MPFPPTPNLGLVLPIPTVDVGPAWATMLNTAFQSIDAQVLTQLVINNNLSFGGFYATNMGALDFASQFSPLTDLNSLFVVGNDLYFNDGAGNTIRFTQAGALDASSIEGFTGLGGTTGSAVYSGGTGTFTFYKNTNQTANVAIGALTVYPTGTHANGITLLSPSGLSSGLVFTMPSTVPGRALPMLLTPTSTTTATIITGQITGSQISSSAGILGSQLSSSANIAGSQLSASANITGSQLSASANIAGSQLSSSANIYGSQLSSSAGVTGGQIANTTITNANMATQTIQTLTISSGGGWSTSGGGCSFWKDQCGMVHLAGIVTYNQTGSRNYTQAFQLATGFRPSAAANYVGRFAVASLDSSDNLVAVEFTVNPSTGNGGAETEPDDGTSFYLDSLHFLGG
jgi:hypothetical protein